VLIIWESSIGAFLLTALLPHLPCYYPLHIIYFMHLLSTNHKCTQPCYFPLPYKPATSISPCHTNLLLRRWWWRIHQRGVLGLHCPGCYSCGVMESSTVLFCKIVVLVFRDIIYVLIILYLYHLVICEHFWSDPGHTCNVYLILLAKSGMTEMVPEPCQP
jgi:hypothetical protein